MPYRKISLKPNPLLLFAMLFCTLLLLSCGDGNEANISNVSSTNTGTGDLSFNLAFHDTGSGVQRQAAVINCAGLGITTVEATVSDQNNTFLARGGPWRCDTGQGTISAVPAGSGRAVLILAKDSDGNLIYSGQNTGIYVVASSKNSAGIIKCNSLTPILQAPADEAVIPANALNLKWNAVVGASEYRVIVSTNDDLSDPFIDAMTPYQNYAPLDLTVGEIYYWRIIAGDVYGNEGMGSRIWSFAVRDIKNMIQDPFFQLTRSGTDTRYWGFTEPDMEVEFNTFNIEGEVSPNGNPAVKIFNRTTPNGNFL